MAGNRLNLAGALSDGARYIADRELSRSTVEDDFGGRNCAEVNFGERAEI
jgi:hypothetical protein